MHKVMAMAFMLVAWLSACATKQFDELHDIPPDVADKLTCDDIERELHLLDQHERGVDEEATTGQVQQIIWGGMWSVMADEKLEHIARQDIRDRERLLYELKVEKGCK